MFKHSLFRYNYYGDFPEHPLVPAYLHVRSYGHYIVGPEFQDERAKKNFLELFWGVRGVGNFKHGDEVFQLRPRTIFFYLPGDFHDLEVISPNFEYYWVTFDGVAVSDMVRHFNITREVRSTDRCPVELFATLDTHLSDFTPRGEYLAGATAYQILTLAIAGNPSPNTLFERFKQQVQERFTEPELTVEQLAGEFGVHRSTLSRIVMNSTGTTPAKYINYYRLQQAVRMLRNSSFSIKEIAEMTGFSDQNYFNKVIRRTFRHAPSWFRKAENDK